VEDEMTGTIESTTGPRRRARHALAFAAFCVALVGVLAVSTAGARDAKVLGKTKRTPQPACPNREHPERCEVVGRVTGFPLVANGEKRPFNVRERGKIVAWAIDLSKPKKSQRRFFGDLFRNAKYGKAPTARLAVIKHKRKRRYKLLRQSPIVNLTSALGRKQLITLDKPLRIRRGQVVALTYPTWAPNFAHNGLRVKRNRWRASRSPRNCAPKSGDPQDINAFARKSRPHQKIGSERGYGCKYRGARLLYWAYYVRAR
jgi:hypothetical protein